MWYVVQTIRGVQARGVQEALAAGEVAHMQELREAEKMIIHLQGKLDSAREEEAGLRAEVARLLMDAESPQQVATEEAASAALVLPLLHKCARRGSSAAMHLGLASQH